MKFLLKRILTPICFIVLILCSWSCSFVPGKSSGKELLPGWSQQKIEFTLPSYPDETHPPLVGWKVVYLQGGQTITEVLSATEKAIILNMDKNQPTPVLCYPLTDIQGRTLSFFRPAGCIYPYNHQATWLDGFTADVFFQLAKSKSPEELASSTLLRFNWPRLSQQVAKRIENNQERGRIFSPWFLQEDVLKESILNGTASTRNIKQENLVILPMEELAFPQEQVPSLLLDDNLGLSFQDEIHYRYIPAGKVKFSTSPQEEISQEEAFQEKTKEQMGENLIFPQNNGYETHQENVFLMGTEILSVFTKKNQKPVLATMSIERYTEGDETF